jgi:hypothetical protein
MPDEALGCVLLVSVVDVGLGALVWRSDHESRITVSAQPPAPPLASDDIDSF